jgi:microcystin-dependent protein
MFIYYQDINSTQWVPASAPVTSSSAVPPGSIVDFAGAAAPSGWYFCDGSLKNRTMDAPLFAAIGTLYGAGDGSTTFGLPDLRGRVTAGADPTGLRLGNGRPGGFTGAGSAVLGAVAGEQNHTQIVAEQATMPCQSNAVGGMNYVSFQGYGAQITVVGSGPSPVYQAPIADTTAVGGGLAHNNVAPTLIVNKIIKA